MTRIDKFCFFSREQRVGVFSYGHQPNKFRRGGDSQLSSGHRVVAEIQSHFPKEYCATIVAQLLL
jgi:hypothetical protein